MTRITTTVLIVMLLMNGTVTIIEGSGLAEDAGVEIAPGISERMDKVTNRAQEGFDPSKGAISTFIDVTLGARDLFMVLVEGMFALPAALRNMGLPSWFVNPFFVPLYVVSVLEILYLVIGRQLL